MDIEVPVRAPVTDDVVAIGYLPCVGGYRIREVDTRKVLIAQQKTMLMIFVASCGWRAKIVVAPYDLTLFIDAVALSVN